MQTAVSTEHPINSLPTQAWFILAKLGYFRCGVDLFMVRSP
ncbi:MAG: hypothetical protein V7K40_01570 [Nostoc sp.]